MSMVPASDTLCSGYNVELASSEACRWSSQLRCYGQGKEENWGFRIYRTTYTPGSDRGKEEIDRAYPCIHTDRDISFRHRPEDPVFTFTRSMLQSSGRRRHAKQADLGENEEHGD